MIDLYISFDGKIPSTNKLYMYSPRNRSIILTNEARKFKTQTYQYLKDRYKSIDVADYKGKYLNLFIAIIMKSNWESRDLSNIIKAVEDTVFEFLGLNDNKVIEIASRKYYRPNSSKEYLNVKLTISDLNLSKYADDKS